MLFLIQEYVIKENSKYSNNNNVSNDPKPEPKNEFSG